MGNNDNRVVTWSALNSFIIENGGSPKKPSGANSLALEYGEFSDYAPIATSTESGIVISNYTGLGGGAYTNKQLVIEKDVSWVTVLQQEPEPQEPTEKPVESIAISPKTATIDLYNNSNPTQLYTVTYTPSDADNRSVTWSSSNTAVATIDSNGIATGLSVGTTTITATTPNGKSDTATLNVVNNAPAETYTYTINAGHDQLEGRRAWFASSDSATPYYSTTIQNGKAVFTTNQQLDTVKGYIESDSADSMYFAEPSLISTSHDGVYRTWNSHPTWMHITANTADSNYIGASESSLDLYLYTSNVTPQDGEPSPEVTYSNEPYGFVFLKWTLSASLYTNPHIRTYKISIDDSAMPYVCTNNGQTIQRNGEITINAQKQSIDWSKIVVRKVNSSEEGWSASLSGNILTVNDGSVSHTNSINNEFGNMSASLWIRGIDPPFTKIPAQTSTTHESSWDRDQYQQCGIRIFV